MGYKVCSKVLWRRNGYAWWWNEDVKEAAYRKKERSTQGNVSEHY